MEFLPSILTDAEVATFAATAALMTAIIQQLSFVPIPDGSKARAWIVSVLSAIFVGLSVPGSGHEGPALALAVMLSWSALAAASLGINRAGAFTAHAIEERASKPPVRDYDLNGE